tara:strand:- start:1625 stop:1783 length:159 start_codon:yes stop_codon:yes gene_type:complete
MTAPKKKVYLTKIKIKQKQLIFKKIKKFNLTYNKFFNSEKINNFKYLLKKKL